MQFFASLTPAMTHVRRAFLLVALVACSERPPGDKSAVPSPPIDGSPSATLGPDGYGPVKIGWTLAELNAALKQNLKPKYEVNEACDYITPTGLPPGMALMIENDTIVRIDVDSAGVLTAAGAQVGDDEAKVLKLYGDRVSVMPHKYTGPEGHYLVVSFTADTMARIIFET
ncbi:MAG: hypothetical protein ABI877_23515, partial [Gemmatimonadaceae bacterium]